MCKPFLPYIRFLGWHSWFWNPSQGAKTLLVLHSDLTDTSSHSSPFLTYYIPGFVSGFLLFVLHSPGIMLFLCLLFCGILSAVRRRIFMEASSLDHLFTQCLAVAVCICSHLLREEASWWLEKALVYWVNELASTPTTSLLINSVLPSLIPISIYSP